MYQIDNTHTLAKQIKLFSVIWCADERLPVDGDVGVSHQKKTQNKTNNKTENNNRKTSGSMS